MEIQYANVKAVSQDITKIADLADSLKNLYHHKDTVDENAVRKYEQEFGDRKFAVIQWLSNDDNYNTFKSSPDAKIAFFFKNVNDGLYAHEIGLNSNLKDKIYRDFKTIHEQTPSEELMTLQEKKLLKHYEDNSVPEEKRTFFKAEAAIVLTVFAKSKCFHKAWGHVHEHLPAKEVLDSGAKKILATLKEFPHFLHDHPNHFLVNKTNYKDKAPDISALFDTIQDASMGNPEAKAKLIQHNELFDDFIQKNPQKMVASELRAKAEKPKIQIDSPKFN